VITYTAPAAAQILAPDVVANRPAATAVPAGTVYPATNASWSRSDGTVWVNLPVTI
jgi:hypothetical protein